MTPEKILDYSIKFGVLPFMLYMVYITRQDLNATRQDVKELQALLIDCYQDKASSRPLGLNEDIFEGVRVYAVLPNKSKTIKECLA